MPAVALRCACLLVVPILGAQTPDARELVDRAGRAIQNYKSYRIETLTVVEMKGGPFSGRLEVPTSATVRRPDRMRIESKNPTTSMTIVSDGKFTYWYLSSQGKYIKRAAVGSADAALTPASFLKDMPDVKSSVQSLTVTGEDIVDIEGQKIACWIVEQRFGPIALESQQTRVEGAVLKMWIDKQRGLTLANRLTAKLRLLSTSEVVDMMQSSETRSLKLGLDLPDSLFVFDPPDGATETEDWTLPGVTKPDVLGKPAPSFQAKALDGASVDLAGLKGKTVLLEFWTTWSAPAQGDLSALEKIYREHRKELAVIGVDVGEDRATAEKYVEGARVSFPVVGIDEANPLAGALFVTQFPTMVLIGADGKVSAYEVGARGEAKLRGDIAKAASR